MLITESALIAIGTALEIEFGGLHRQLEALSHETDRARFEEGVNHLSEHLPAALAAIAALHYTHTAWESVLATYFALGVGVIPHTGKVLKKEDAFAAVEESHLLNFAVNPLPETQHAITVRAAALSKVLKGQIVQDLRDSLDELDGLDMPNAKEALGEMAKGLSNLVEDAHVHSHVTAQMDLAKGYGQFSAIQRPTLLQNSPFQEFYRAEHRVEWRNWPERWAEQGGSFFPGVSDYPEGRMIAEAGSAIWEALASYPDGTGQPYPPFAWNSGMGVKTVSREEAAKLGLLGRHNVPPKPRKLDFNAGIQFSADFDDDIKSALLDQMTDFVERNEELEVEPT